MNVNVTDTKKITRNAVSKVLIAVSMKSTVFWTVT